MTLLFELLAVGVLILLNAFFVAADRDGRWLGTSNLNGDDQSNRPLLAINEAMGFSRLP